MPKAAAVYAERENLREVRAVQNDILADYRDDFSKHITAVNIPKVEMIWDSIPRHLSKEKKKFVYKELKSGARACAYEDAMNWLFNTRLVYKIARTEENKLPLASFADQGIFKLFMLDIGLLGAKAELDIGTVLEPDNGLFGIFNGAMTEQYVMQELKAAGFTPYYWGREKGAAEVDFVVQWRNEIVPVEVKAGFRAKSKSLDVYRGLYHPAHTVRAALRNFGKHDDVYSTPLYMIAEISDLMEIN
jgi:predicted AAA+ superfamily ATPase